MAKLSPKALRFLDAVMTRSGSDEARAVWSTFEPAPGKEIPGEVAKAVLGPLKQAELDLCEQLRSTSIGEDDAADLSNDLGFIRAIRRDLDRQIGEDVAKTEKKGPTLGITP